MKKMLITGASRGIGRAIVTEFKWPKATQAQYELITVARTGDVSIHGDLTDLNFVHKLIADHDIDVLVNCAGIVGSTFYETNMLNYIVPGILMTEFYKKMKSGFIFNIGSNAAYERGQWIRYVNEESVYYFASKQALKALSNLLSDSALNTEVKVVSIEPMLVDTMMNGGNAYAEPHLHLIQPQDIAATIRWITEQPDWIQVNSIHMTNKRKSRK